MADQAGGSIAFRFHARDVHLVLSPGAHEPIPYRVLVDGGPRARHTGWTPTRPEQEILSGAWMPPVVKRSP